MESQRLNEYSPWVNPQYGGGEGALFLQFITEELKPYIDAHYRTKQRRQVQPLQVAAWVACLAFMQAFKGRMFFQRLGPFLLLLVFTYGLHLDSTATFGHIKQQSIPHCRYCRGKHSGCRHVENA